ncbi:unnamed protein product, partial [Larinioides sclopetarius]
MKGVGNIVQKKSHPLSMSIIMQDYLLRESFFLYFIEINKKDWNWK